MIKYERIDVFKGIDLNKTGTSKEYMLCHYWYFENIDYEQYVCDGCHDLLMIFYNLDDFMILNIKGDL